MTPEELFKARVSLEALQDANQKSDILVFDYSNDKDVSSHIPHVVERVEGLKASTKVGLVVGTGGLFTWGGLLPSIDMWIQIDKNPTVIQWVRNLSEKVSNADSLEEYQYEVFGGLLRNRPAVAVSTERYSFGDWHYLNNKRSFERAQDFVRRDSVARVLGNVEDSEFLNKVGSALRAIDGQIVFANMTNVWDFRWVKDKSGRSIDSSLTQLPFHPEASFLSTSNYRGLIARHDIGYGSYQARAMTLLTEERARRREIGDIVDYPIQT